MKATSKIGPNEHDFELADEMAELDEDDDLENSPGLPPRPPDLASDGGTN